MTESDRVCVCVCELGIPESVRVEIPVRYLRQYVSVFSLATLLKASRISLVRVRLPTRIDSKLEALADGENRVLQKACNM